MEEIKGTDINRAVFDYASMAIVVVNNSGTIVRVNPFALREFGYNPGELAGKSVETLIPARFHESHKHHHAGYMANPKSRPMGIGMSLFARRKDGTEFPVEISLGNYESEGEKLVVAFITNISIRKKSEEQVKKLNDELEMTVEKRTRELTEALQQLEASKEELTHSLEKEKELSELKSRFVSMASHEFRTPLSTILSSAYLVEKYRESAEQPRREKHLSRIISSVNMLTDILNDFLSVGKIEEGRIQTRFADFDMQRTTDTVLQELQTSAKKGQLIVYHHEGPAVVYLDVSLLRHILMNLVSNAIKFSPEQAEITVTTLVEDGAITLKVQDRGIGILPEDQPHLMERFFRGNNATNIQGTGLGLHIVGKYAELMNGTISCESEPGKGTIFTVRFETEKKQTYENTVAD